MIHDYDNPNTCYAIGDSFSVFMGTADTNRQPSAGVFEEVSTIIKDGATDEASLYDGSARLDFILGSSKTNQRQGEAAQTYAQTHNMAIKIGNTVYLKKPGTTDRVAVSGVQVDA